MLFTDPYNSQCQLILPLGKHHRRPVLFRVVFQRHREMSRVSHNHIRLGNLLHHTAHRHLTLQLPDSPFDLRIPLSHLIFFLYLLLGHLEIVLVIPSLVKVIKKRYYRKSNADLYYQLKHQPEHLCRG